MGSTSVYHVTFTLTNSAGNVTAGPYNTFVGIAAGTRGDLQSPSVTAALATAISSNLLAILQAQGFAGSAAPGGTVNIEHYDHASAPDVYT